jgi:hypothetical protein
LPTFCSLAPSITRTVEYMYCCCQCSIFVFASDQCMTLLQWCKCIGTSFYCFRFLALVGMSLFSLALDLSFVFLCFSLLPASCHCRVTFTL